MIRCYGTRIHLVGMGLVILLTNLADGMESPSASLAIVGGYGKGKVCILLGNSANLRVFQMNTKF
ncbi:MAG: hypothetical protein PUD67_07860 [Prevotellaceae bacterium]|nr:hypothetical protein [Prevotellaceae bacterium]